MNNEISIINIMQLVIKRWWIIIISSIVIGGIAFAYSYYFITPTYVSKGMIYVNNANALNIANINNQANKNLNLSDLVASQRLATTYIEILMSDSFMGVVCDEIGLGYSPSKLRSMISIKSKNETEILEINVTNTSVENAVTIVESVLENSKDQITKVIKGGSVEIIDHANTPSEPAGPNIIKYTMLGIIIGMILGVFLIFITDLIDNRIKNQEDLVEKYDYPILGLIPGLRSSKNSYYGNLGVSNSIKTS